VAYSINMVRKGGRKTSVAKGRRGRRTAMRGRMRRARSSRVGEYASAKQTIELPNDSVNTLYQLTNVALNQFDRLSQIAGCYQFFRINLIEMKFKPSQDTFIAGGTTVPYFLHLIDKDEVLIPVGGLTGFNQIRDAGAVPIRFDDKTLTVRWKPRVPQVIAADNSTFPTLNWGMASKVSPWLATNHIANQDPGAFTPSRVPHKGLYYGVQQDVGSGDYSVEITVHAQFRKALTFTASGPGTTLATEKEMVLKNPQSA